MLSTVHKAPASKGRRDIAIHCDEEQERDRAEATEKVGGAFYTEVAQA
jgi:hypothetical protein